MCNPVFYSQTLFDPYILSCMPNVYIILPKARHFPLYDPTPPAAGKSASLQNLRSNFPLKVFVEGAEKKKIFWSDIEVSSGDLSSGNNSKKQRIDGEVTAIKFFSIIILELIYI